MGHAPASILGPWDNFYVIIGSSAAALTGLVFVVITIISGSARAPRSHEGTATFTTPTVVHFCEVLFVAAALSVPWPSLRYVGVVLALAGLFGLTYVSRIAYRIRRMSTYDADTEDWVWHTLLPVLAYGAMLAGALALPAFDAKAMFGFAFAVVVLIFVGIHNAWDIVTYLAVDSPEKPASPWPAETSTEEEPRPTSI